MERGVRRAVLRGQPAKNKANKPSNKLTNRQTFLCLVSTRLRGEDIAGESLGGGLGVGLAESHHQV